VTPNADKSGQEVGVNLNFCALYGRANVHEHIQGGLKQVVRFRTQTALPRSVTVSILRMTVCTISDNESNIV